MKYSQRLPTRVSSRLREGNKKRTPDRLFWRPSVRNEASKRRNGFLRSLPENFLARSFTQTQPYPLVFTAPRPFTHFYLGAAMAHGLT